MAGSRRILASVCPSAHKSGLRPGMALAKAQAQIPQLHVFDATPDEDEAALRELARWAIRYSPVVALDPPDGLWIDIAGAAHLFGGEEKLLSDLTSRLTSRGFSALAAVADAPGTAWAVARYGTEMIVPTGRAVDAIASLPVHALRLSPDVPAAMHRLGIDRIGQLAAMPRAPMVRRFGKETALRLDQAMGHAFEPITPLIPEETPLAALAFAESIARLDDIKHVLHRLSKTLCADLAKRGEGVRRLDLVFRRVDQKGAALRIGTAKATRDHAHLAKLFHDQLETVDPGFGIEEIVLIASRVEAMVEMQMMAQGIADSGASDIDLSRLVDRLASRLGAEHVYRLVPAQSHVPERMTRRVPALAPPRGETWPRNLPRPTRLLDPPESIRATALLPDHPPVMFIWRKVRHQVDKADGPERIAPEWWQGDKDGPSRDYYRVETDQGGRFWIFRDAPMDEGGRWWMHGFFG
ncbi:DNA polymerase Y family protein [Microvirga sp. BT291]|nr:DNA polymerase Y family protein [Microvirga pudoricolor]